MREKEIYSWAPVQHTNTNTDSNRDTKRIRNEMAHSLKEKIRCDILTLEMSMNVNILRVKENW